MDWEQVKLRIGQIEALGLQSFSRTLLHWRDDAHWTSIDVDGDLEEDVAIPDKTVLTVRGNTRASISSVGTALVHIHRDQYGSLDLGGPAEVIVAGSVRNAATVSAKKRTSLFVGGSLEGRVTCIDTSSIHIDGHMKGLISSGYPATRIVVRADWVGGIQPNSKSGLLTLFVDGYVSNSQIESIGLMHYSSAVVYAGASDAAPGVHTVLDTPPEQRTQHYSWIIGSTGSPQLGERD